MGTAVHEFINGTTIKLPRRSVERPDGFADSDIVRGCQAAETIILQHVEMLEAVFVNK